jgi:anhydro-N-acetylmuramic acid kinase
MVYRAIGLMSGSSLDGVDIAFAEFQESAGKWSYEILKADCYPYSDEWIKRLKNATKLSALDYQLLHVEYGHLTGKLVKKFIEENKLNYQVALIASHGHTTFHLPSKGMTAQLGDGAAIAAETGLPVVTDLRALDVAYGGQGAPIVPIGEKMLWNEYDYFLNIGGIANISVSGEPPSGGWGFDICPANRVLNMLANDAGKNFDDEGKIAASGSVNSNLLEKLNQLDYYKQPFPKSLANEYGIDVIYPIIKESGSNIPDALRTFAEHIAVQIKNAIANLNEPKPETRNLPDRQTGPKLLATGGGVFNSFLMKRIKDSLKESNLPAYRTGRQAGIDVIIPDAKLVNCKEALIMAFIGILRWRQENNVLSSVTGATRDSIGGALWTGQEA